MNTTTSEQLYGFRRPELNYILGVGGTMVFIIAGKGFSYLFQLTLTYKFGAAIAGIFTLWFTCINILSFISRWGLDVLSVQLIPKYKYSPAKQWFTIKSVVSIAIKTSVISSVIWLIVHSWIAENVFHNSSLVTPFFYCVFILFSFNILYLSGGILRGFKQFYSFAFIQHFFLHFIAFIILYFGESILNLETFSHFGIFSFAGGISISAFAGVFLVYKCYPKGILPKKTNDKILRAGTPFAFSNLSYFLISWMDALLIGFFLDNESVGIFNLILRIAMIISLPVLGINSVSGPRISDAFFSKSISKLKNSLLFTVRVGFSTAIPLALIILFFRTNVLALFGTEFESAVIPLTILAVSQFFHAVTGSAGLALQMMNRARDLQNILIVAVLLKLVLGAFLIPKYGITGATINVMFVTLFWKITTWVMLIKRYNAFKTSITV